MTPQEINIAVAELCGWKWTRIEADGGCYGWVSPRGGFPQNVDALPNFYADLNACAEFEAAIPDDQFGQYHHILTSIRNDTCLPVCRCVSATAPQRCTAFLRVHGKWRDK